MKNEIRKKKKKEKQNLFSLFLVLVLFIFLLVLRGGFQDGLETQKKRVYIIISSLIFVCHSKKKKKSVLSTKMKNLKMGGIYTTDDIKKKRKTIYQ